ncbi:MAG: DHH family phosphoesterase [Deltaproteobacteria bacterium]|nr:DHH family phosphoesterase [Deltaproteobacteria bacterium]
MADERGFQQAVREGAAVFASLAQHEVFLFHHNDADGLSSGAILAQAIERKGLRLRRFCLEKPYPEVLRAIIQDPEVRPDTVLVFADFASGMLRQLLEINAAQLPLFVIDHHALEQAKGDNLYVINCTQFGIDSDPACSASAISYLFAHALSPLNEDLAALGVVGAVGDGLFSSDGKMCGINAISALAAEQNGSLKLVEGEYFLARPDWVSARTVANELNALGGFGYFRGGPDVGVKGLRDGRNAAFSTFAQEFRAEFERAFDLFTQTQFLHKGHNVQWFILDSQFKTFGVKSVGLVCEELIRRNLVDAGTYLAGFQVVPDEIPGLGIVKLQQTKVSMRLPERIKADVLAGKAPSLARVLPEATRKVDGFIDACHPHAAATTIRQGDERKLIAALEVAISSSRAS